MKPFSWTAKLREIDPRRTLVMGILNVTPDSFSDGGKFLSIDEAIKHAETMIDQGADILDIGGESSRPGSKRVDPDEEISRVVPVIAALAKRFETPISVDTYKSKVAEAAINAGAEIINDISAFRFDPQLPSVVATNRVGVVLMHSRGEFETLHSTPHASDIFEDVTQGFHRAIAAAEKAGASQDTIALDVGIGFGKTLEQNLSLITGISRLRGKFPGLPFLIGTSRKSFIGKVLGGVPVDERLEGSLATAAIAVYNGVNIIRTHDIKETLATLQMVDELCKKRSSG
jgi:dihydropteroate synthase